MDKATRAVNEPVHPPAAPAASPTRAESQREFFSTTSASLAGKIKASLTAAVKTTGLGGNQVAQSLVRVPAAAAAKGTGQPGPSARREIPH